jgi:hypothetical protein
MSTTRFRTSEALGLPFALALSLLAALPAASSQVLLPTIVVGAFGANDSVWGSEVRAINRSDVPKQLALVDWIGTPGFRPSSYTVEPHATLSLGGSQVFGGTRSEEQVPVGLAVCEADDGLLIQSVVMGGPAGASFNPFGSPCPAYDGVGPGFYGPCSPFAGPIVEGVKDFFQAGAELFLSWLHTSEDRRTNLVLFNADPTTAHVTVTVFSADSRTTQAAGYEVQARGTLQLNDIFSKVPWKDIRFADGPLQSGAATATITGDTRLYAVAYVISNFNNSLTISLPR